MICDVWILSETDIYICRQIKQKWTVHLVSYVDVNVFMLQYLRGQGPCAWRSFLVARSFHWNYQRWPYWEHWTHMHANVTNGIFSKAGLSLSVLFLLFFSSLESLNSQFCHSSLLALPFYHKNSFVSTELWQICLSCSFFHCNRVAWHMEGRHSFIDTGISDRAVAHRMSLARL